MERVIAVVLTWALRRAVIDDIVLDLWYLNSHFLPLFSLSLSRGASAVSNNGPFFLVLGWSDAVVPIPLTPLYNTEGLILPEMPSA